MSDRYRQAVMYATEFLRGQFTNGQLSTQMVEPSEFILIFGLNITNGWDDHPWCGSYYTYPEHAFLELLSRADTDKGAFDIASRITASRLFRDEPMSPEERVFAGQVVAGIRKCPPPEGKRLTPSFALNVHIVMLAQLLVDRFQLNLMRNDEVALPMSACDAVADALAALGHTKSPRAIKELLTHKSSRRVREVVDAVRAFQQRRRSGS